MARILLFFLITLVVLNYGCAKKESNTDKVGLAKGTEGILINFLQGNPQNTYLVSEQEEPMTAIIEVRNKGSYPEQEAQSELSRGQIFLSGFDTNIIRMDRISERLDRKFLQGKSSINPQGGFDTIEFKGSIASENIVIDKYEPTILATICYPYVTKASPTICIDPFPFDEKQKKVCKIGSQNLQSQGAPIAITKIDQEASSSKIQFKISLKNLGKGDVINTNALEKCNPYESQGLQRDDFDRIELIRAEAGIATLDCGPFTESNIIRLNNGEGFVICSIGQENYQDAKSAYTTPLNLEFRYGYRTTASKPIKIAKITTTG